MKRAALQPNRRVARILLLISGVLVVAALLWSTWVVPALVKYPRPIST